MPLPNIFKFSAGSKKKIEEAVGLDVGSFSVKAARIKKDAGAFHLAGFGYAKISSHDRAGVVDAIKKACADAGVFTKKVNASIFSEGVIVRYLLLPEMSPEELNKAMNFEIERYVPFKREEVVSDYLILREDESKKSIKVLLVAAKREFVDSRTHLIREAGFEPQIVTIDSLVIKNSFHVNYPEKNNATVALLNIGSKVTNINIVRNNLSYFMRDVQIGGDNITHLLKEKLDIIDEKEAELMKYNLTNKNEEMVKVVEPVLGNLLNEIYLSFDYYESEFGLTVDEIYISGGSSGLEFIVQFLKENLALEIFNLDPIKNITLSPEVSYDFVKSHSAFLPVCEGLALETFF